MTEKKPRKALKTNEHFIFSNQILQHYFSLNTNCLPTEHCITMISFTYKIKCYAHDRHPKPHLSAPCTRKQKTGQKQNLPLCLVHATLYTPQTQPSHHVSHLLINRAVWDVVFVAEIWGSRNSGSFLRGWHPHGYLWCHSRDWKMSMGCHCSLPSPGLQLRENHVSGQSEGISTDHMWSEITCLLSDFTWHPLLPSPILMSYFSLL